MMDQHWSTGGGMDFEPFMDESLHHKMAPLSIDGQPPKAVSPQVQPKTIDMRLAQPGTDESKPGYMTPLSSYTAQTFWYFWHADMVAPASGVSNRRVSEDLRSSSSRPFDSEGRHRHLLHGSVHPKQVLPNSSFCQFVISILHSTQVSFSVTILALMYTYKYEKVMALGLRPPFHSPVTEAQAFVTALMLANKYLDDNTYTNSTWAAFLKLSVKEVNEYELEWLDALQFNLHVGKEEFETWRAMLDAHVANQQRADAAAASNLVAVTSPGRARSESPPLAYYAPAGLTPSADHHIMRKRSARDAFATDLVHNTGFYEAARLRPRKSSFVSLAPMAFPAAPPAPTALVPQANNGAMGLGRSSSLTRQIARLPTGRRDSSAGQENAMLDLRHAAAVNAAQTWQFPANGALSAGQPRLYFLQAAATPLAGPDGRFHKSIPHYFDPNFNPNFQFPMPQVQRHEMMDVDMNQVDLTSPTEAVHMAAVQPIMVPTLAMPLPHPTGIPMHFPEPQPAQFANAGPPGYAYGAQGWSLPAPPPPPQWQRTWKPGHASRWSTSSDEGLVFNLPRAPMCHTEWPTPVPVRY